MRLLPVPVEMTNPAQVTIGPVTLREGDVVTGERLRALEEWYGPIKASLTYRRTERERLAVDYAKAWLASGRNIAMGDDGAPVTADGLLAACYGAVNAVFDDKAAVRLAGEGE